MFTLEVTILPVPKGQKLAEAVGFLGPDVVGQAEGKGLKTPAYVWRGATPELLPAGPHKDVKVRAASGSIAVGLRGSGDKSGAIAWRAGAADPIDLHPAGFASSYAMACGGDAQVGTGVRKPKKGPSVELGLIWRGAADRVEELPADPDGLALLATDGTTHAGAIGSRAALWRDGAPTLLGPTGRTTIANAVAGDVQCGELFVGRGPHAVLWRSTEASLVDLHPAGFESSQALACAGDLQVGHAKPQEMTSTGFGALEAHAFLWTGTAASALDLHTAVPAPWNTSRARAITVDGDVVHIAGCVERVELENGSPWCAARQPCVWVARRR